MAGEYDHGVLSGYFRVSAKTGKPSPENQLEHKHYSPEQRLQAMIISRGIMDARGSGISCGGAQQTVGSRKKIQAEAINWFLSDLTDMGSFLFAAEALDLPQSAIDRVRNFAANCIKYLDSPELRPYTTGCWSAAKMMISGSEYEAANR